MFSKKLESLPVETKPAMSEDKDIIKELTAQEYEHGFVTDVEQEFIPKGLNEDIIRLISAKHTR